jgi:hypothetical protein
VETAGHCDSVDQRKDRGQINVVDETSQGLEQARREEGGTLGAENWTRRGRRENGPSDKMTETLGRNERAFEGGTLAL